MTSVLTIKWPRVNYSSDPKNDVEILPDVRHCECGKEIVWDPKGGSWSFGGWKHADGTVEHYVTAQIHCAYCNAEGEELVHFKFQPYSDEVSCDRCGGVTGRAIGD